MEAILLIIIIIIFSQCEPKGSIGRVVFLFFFFCFLSVHFFSFLLMLSGRFDTAGRAYGRKRRYPAFWGSVFFFFLIIYQVVVD
jgi:hypothetical protein